MAAECLVALRFLFCGKFESDFHQHWQEQCTASQVSLESIKSVVKKLKKPKICGRRQLLLFQKVESDGGPFLKVGFKS